MSKILGVTASGNVDKKSSWKGLKDHHLKHDPSQNHDNKFLNTNESKNLQRFNVHFESGQSFEDVVEKYFGNYMFDHDLNTKGYRWENAKNFVTFDTKGKRRRNALDFAFMEKIADEDTWDKLYKELETTYKTQSVDKRKYFAAKYDVHSGRDYAAWRSGLALKTYMEGFAERNSELTLIEGYSHVDEKGAPHAHMELMATPDKEKELTKSGRVKKPSTSLNKALRKQYPQAQNNKEALAMWRKQEDEAILDAFNNAGLTKEFKLVRKTELDPTIKTGRSHAQYIHDKIEEQQKLNNVTLSKLQAEQKELAAKRDDVAKQKAKLESDFAAFKANLDAGRENALDDYKQAYRQNLEDLKKLNDKNFEPEKVILLGATMLANAENLNAQVMQHKRKQPLNKAEANHYRQRGADLYDFLTGFCQLEPAEAMRIKDLYDDVSVTDLMDEPKKTKQKDEDLLKF